ncbi:MAG: type I-A CRISPR-associated protein Cas5 [Candidatus Odinarchaeota archaeon]|nr:type I-A CRISPR-associated protein Cas5 [Candidatus Odinarchaeota archaeon]
MSKLMALSVNVGIFWGYASREVPMSKSRRCFIVPPPTTLIGALSYPLACMRRMPEIILENGEFKSTSSVLRRAVVSAHLKYDASLVRRADLEKVYFRYLKKDIVQTDAIAIERVYSYPRSEQYPKMTLLYLIDEKVAEEIMGERWDRVILASAWGIMRIGQKEGLVSTLNVGFHEVEPIEMEEGKGWIETRYYFPSEAVENLEGSFMLARFVDHKESEISSYEAAKRLSYCIPNEGGVKVVPSDEAFLVKVGNEYVLSLRRWLDGR